MDLDLAEVVEEETIKDERTPITLTNLLRLVTSVIVAVKKVRILSFSSSALILFSQKNLLVSLRPSTGHWIQDCPTNGDAAYENRPRIKRTTGIPKSFLTEVAGPGPKTGEEGEGTDGASMGLVMDHKSGVMVTADGGFVVARPDK